MCVYVRFENRAGGMAFDVCPDNMLEVLSSEAMPTPTRLAALFFGLSIIGLGIPIFCILMR